MNPNLKTVLAELERHGAEHDAGEPDRQRRMLNITPDTGALLGILVRAMRVRQILELGTSNGYSTLWLTDAARDTGGRVTTVEIQEWKATLARESLRRGGLEEHVDLVVGDAGVHLAGAAEGAYELVFLDTDRSHYVRWWPDLRRALAAGGLLVVDNAVSHAEELREFADLVRDDPEFTSVTVPVGNGELLAYKVR